MERMFQKPIRSNEVTANVSEVAAHANIREILVAMQQQLAARRWRRHGRT